MGNNRRYWDWPQWDISTLSWLSKTQIGDKSYVKTNAYWNTFHNIVDFDRTLSTSGAISAESRLSTSMPMTTLPATSLARS